MKYPDFKTYEILYKKYLAHSPEPLLNLAEPIKAKTVLDICGGSGRLSELAIKRGAELVYLVDQEKGMINPGIWLNPKIKPIISELDSALRNFIKNDQKFNIVFCQQAVNYWFGKEIILLIAEVLSVNGVFVFNTFNQKPSRKPRVKNYQVNAINYVEVNWLVLDDLVHHVQIAEGMPSHTTYFLWISPERFMEILSSYFETRTIIDGPTTLYCCTRI